jgi:hypothetical protein
MDIRGLIHALSVLLESTPEKLRDMTTIEGELKEAEQMIQRYFTTMKTFQSQIENVGFPITISGTNLFLEELNKTLFEELQKQEIPQKIKHYQFLLSQLKIIQSIMGGIHSKFQTSGNMPTCKICLVEECSNAFSPCGHLVCDKCLSHLEPESRCYFCRKRIKNILKLFSI